MTDELFTGYDLFGLEALRQRLPALQQHIPAVRAAGDALTDDIEPVHQLRVASRRLRAAFALFADSLPTKRAAEWQKQIRRITKALGAARDTDVQFEWLRDYLARVTDAAEVPGINRLLLRLYQQRQRLQADVISALDKLEETRTLTDMQAALHDLVVRARLELVDARSPQVYAQAEQAISRPLEEFLAYDVFVYQPDRATELHAMRIAAKHLRYTLEIFAELYSDELKKPLKAVKEMQELLGTLHDCDVWIAFVPQFEAEERARTLDYFGVDTYAQRFTPGLRALCAHRQAQRDETYAAFVKYWERTQTNEVWARLRQAVRPATPPVSEEAAPPTSP